MKKITFKTWKPKWLLWLALILLIKLPSTAQNSAVVTGTIVNANGEPLQGATIRAAGKAQKDNFTTVANEKGVFVLRQLKSGSVYTLTASYVGYEENIVSSFAVKPGNNSVSIRLQPSNNSLNQVVVIGYGTQRRETVTGSIATIKAEDFNAGQITDPMTLIAGKVAGLVISRPNGSDPNAAADFSLRGPATIQGNSQPLIVIDGIPGGDLQTIAPADIASIDILKDGSAAAIYGSRATAGVIIVTTKRGRAGRTTVTYNGSFSVDQVAKKYNMLNADQYKELANKIGTQIDDQGANTDWFKEVTRTPMSQSHNLSVSGGSEKTTYYAALNYRNLQSLDRGGEREFVNGTLRLNTKALNDKMDFSVLLTNAFDKRSFANYGAMAQSLNMNPTYPVRNPDGTFFENPSIPYYLQWNPVANMANNVNSNKEKRLLGNVSLGYLILPGLKATASYSMTRNDFLHGSYSSNEDFFQVQGGTGGQASRSEDNTRTSIIESTINYNKQAGNHNFDVTGGYSYQDIFNEGFGAGNNSFNTNAFLYYNLGAGSALNNLTPNFNRSGVFVNSYANERSLLAYFGRLIYNYEERYLLNITVRREGASVLGKDNKWGTFPGVSAGWVLSKENFMQNGAFVKYLKLRAGYGVTGNQESLQPYQSLAALGPFSQGAYFGTPGNGQWITPYGPTINANPDLRWETKKEVNVGLDFALLKNGWLSGSLEYYNRKINNLVGYYNAQLPSQIFPNIFANAGLMKNEGYEATLNAKFVNTKSFKWNATLTGAYNKNQIVSVTSDQFQGTAHNITDFGLGPVQRLAPGQPVGVFYGRVFAGFTPDGQWLFNNKDGKPVTAGEIGDNDFVYLGNSIPKYNLGLTNNFKVGNFDATILLRSALGFKALNAKRLYHENAVNIYTMNLFTSALNNTVNAEQYFSTYYLEKGDFVKIDNITIGYTLPIKNNLYLQSIRVYVTGTNLATFTGFSGMDPELPINLIFPQPGQEFTAGPGVEPNYGYYPTTRTFTFGISATF